MSRKLTFDGELDTIDGIGFHCAEHADMLYVRVFTRPCTPEFLEQIKSSGLDPLRPIRAVVTMEQDEP